MLNQSKLFSKTWVIKVGGSLLRENHFKSLVKEISKMVVRHPTVLVHGGGKEITLLGERLGVKSHFVRGRRVTDEKMMEVVEMVLSGKVNPHLVRLLHAFEVNAVGLSGCDGQTVRAKRIPSLGWVGQVQSIRTDFIKLLLNKKFVPVFSSIASSGEGHSLNINADEMACALASSMKAETLILFTDQPGILDGNNQTIEQISLKDSKRLIHEEVITGGMIPKVEAAFKALNAGVKTIWILQGKLPLSQSKGTCFTLQPSRSFRNPFKE